MNDIQKEYLQILKAIDEICKKENLSYMLMGGTMLGAIREHGFIKWDDDADIMMHRKEYKAFRKCSIKHLNNYGLFLDERDKMPRLTLARSPEISAEIILIDSLPNNKIKRKSKLVTMRVLQVMLIKDIDYSPLSITRKLEAFAIWCLGRLLSQETKLNLYEKASQIGNNENSRLLFFSNERYRYMNLQLDRNLLKETIRIPFEDTELIVPKEWDAYLKLYYGDDYMIPKRENYYI